MTIDEAMRAVSDEYGEDVARAATSHAFNQLLKQALASEYDEIDRELPEIVAQIAGSMGVKTGTILPPYVYQVARMAFRIGMRVQRKLDHPGEKTTALWRANGKPR